MLFSRKKDAFYFLIIPVVSILIYFLIKPNTSFDERLLIFLVLKVIVDTPHILSTFLALPEKIRSKKISLQFVLRTPILVGVVLYFSQMHLGNLFVGVLALISIVHVILQQKYWSDLSAKLGTSRNWRGVFILLLGISILFQHLVSQPSDGILDSLAIDLGVYLKSMIWLVLGGGMVYSIWQARQQPFSKMPVYLTLGIFIGLALPLSVFGDFLMYGFFVYTAHGIPYLAYRFKQFQWSFGKSCGVMALLIGVGALFQWVDSVVRSNADQSLFPLLFIPLVSHFVYDWKLWNLELKMTANS